MTFETAKMANNTVGINYQSEKIAYQAAKLAYKKAKSVYNETKLQQSCCEYHMKQIEFGCQSTTEEKLQKQILKQRKLHV
jgi:hypothetical protein